MFLFFPGLCFLEEGCGFCLGADSLGGSAGPASMLKPALTLLRDFFPLSVIVNSFLAAFPMTVVQNNRRGTDLDAASSRAG